MPTYQYSCTGCGHFLEQFQSFSDDALTDCPECRGRLRKVFNAVGVVFKGSGFYRTDSRSTDANGSASGSSSDSDSGSGRSSQQAEKSTTSSSDKAGPTGERTSSESSKGATKSGSAA